MAGAEIIASAIGILCLIIFGYVLVGGILNTGENAASAQKDYILQKEIIRNTAIKISSSPLLSKSQVLRKFSSAIGLRSKNSKNFCQKIGALV